MPAKQCYKYEAVDAYLEANPLLPRTFLAEQYSDEGRRRYWVGTLEETTNVIVSSKKRRFHEVVDPNEPCRLFFDLDLKSPSPVDDWDDVLSELHKIVREACAVELHISRPERPSSVWHSHRVETLESEEIVHRKSSHVLYDVWFRTASNCGAFVRRLLETCEDEFVKKCVDVGVYPTSGRRTLRTAYSGKGKNASHPFKRTDDDEFDVDVFLVSSVVLHRTSNDSDLPPLERKLPFVEDYVEYVEPEKFEFESSSFVDDVVSIRDVEERLKTYFKEVRGVDDFRPHSDNLTNGFIGWRVNSMFCPKKLTRHRKNGTYVHCRVYENGTVDLTMRCADEECAHRWTYEDPGMSVVAFPKFGNERGFDYFYV